MGGDEILLIFENSNLMYISKLVQAQMDLDRKTKMPIVDD